MATKYEDTNAPNAVLLLLLRGKMPNQMHYWIVANKDGKTILIYGGLNETEATNKGYQELDCYFDVKAYPTRDIGRASHLFKGETLHDTQDLDKSLQRLKHTGY